MRPLPVFVWILLLLVAFEAGWLLLGGQQYTLTTPDGDEVRVDPLARLFAWLIPVELALVLLWWLMSALNRYPDDLGDGAILWTLMGTLCVWTVRTGNGPAPASVRRGLGRTRLMRVLRGLADEVRPAGRRDWPLLSRERFQIESYHDMAVLQALIHDLKNSVLEHNVVLDELEDTLAPGTGDDALPRLRHSAKDIARRMVELSSLAHLHRLCTEPANMRELTEDILQRLEHMPGAGDIALDCPEDLPAVTLDTALMRMALDNLLRNALQAAPSGGVRLRIGQAGGWLEWELRNPGHLSEDDLARMEQPGWSTRPGGTGLGIPVARKILHRHGGTLRFASQHGEVTALVRLPLQAKDDTWTS